MLKLMEQRADPKYVPDKSNWSRALSVYEQASSVGTKYEGFKPQWYQDVKGNWTIGYGGRDNDPNYSGIPRDGKITQQEAYKKMIETYQAKEQQLLKYPAYKAMSPNEKAGLLDMVYNIGNVGSYTDLTRYLNEPKNIHKVIELIPSFRRASGEVLEGLERRRADDMNLALQKDPTKTYLPLFVK
jgi:GH24 family phage-related lysozyme (muramidase)